MSIRKFSPPGYMPRIATAADRGYMDLAMHIGLWSKYVAHKIGAVIEDGHGHVVSTGMNGHFSWRDDADPTNWTKPARYADTAHAEDNALINARLNGVNVRGMNMHVMRFPCDGHNDEHVCVEGCCRKIVAAGIARVFVYSHPNDAVHERHAPSFRRSLACLLDHGVEIVWHDPDDPVYKGRMTRKPDTAFIPSGSIGWDARFLDLATYLSRLSPGGAGEVIVKRMGHSTEDDEKRMSKIVRACGCAGAEGGGALESASALGVALRDCTLYLSSAPSIRRLSQAADMGITKLFLPASAENRLWMSHHQGECGIGMKLDVPDLQAAPPVRYLGNTLRPHRIQGEVTRVST